MLLEAIRSLAVFCDSDLLESNLHKFSSAWQSAVASAANMVSGDSTVETTLEQSTLTPTDYGALVDVVDALISKLPDTTVARLFGVFVQLLQQCAEGLAKQHQKTVIRPLDMSIAQRSRKNLGSKKGVGLRLLPSTHLSSIETSRLTLQCLLRRAFKGLKHICERIYESVRSGAAHPAYNDIIQHSEPLLELWRVSGLYTQI